MVLAILQNDLVFMVTLEICPVRFESREQCVTIWSLLELHKTGWRMDLVDEALAAEAGRLHFGPQNPHECWTWGTQL